MFLSDISIKRPIMMSMFLIVFVIFGAISYKSMNLEFTPEINLPMVTVQTIYPGAGPQEIETQITKKIEDEVSSVAKIDYIQSYSMENVSYVMVVFDLDKDVYLALQEVKDKVDGVLNDLPDDAETPLVQRYDPTVLPVVDLVLYGDKPVTELYDLADKQLKNRFSQVGGVATVNLVGGQEREIKVSVDGKTVLQQSVPLQQIASILASQNIDMPGGNFERNSQEYAVRLKGEYKDVDTIRNIEIPTSGGIKKLGEIANVADMGAEVRERTTFFDNIGKKGNDNVIQLSVMKNSGSNEVKIYDSIKEVLPEIRKSLPKDCNLDVVNEGTTFTRDSVDDTISNIIMGIILTGLVLLFFLHDYKSTIIIALSMPMSIVSTFLLMKASGFSLNVMSLMGLSTSVGILVTNSVVVLENIFRHKSLGNNKIESASKGTSEIAIAVLASTLTNLVVFIPIGTMSGIAGILFKQFALTVVYATIFSLILSFTLTPMLAAMILPDHDRKKHPIGEWLEKIFKSWDDFYRSVLAWFFRSKIRGGLFIVLSVALLVISFGYAKDIGMVFIPAMDEGRISIKVELPVGYTLDETGRVMDEIGNRLKKYPEITHFWSTLGTQAETDRGVNLALMTVKLINSNDRKMSSQEFAGKLTRDMSDIPNARIRISSVFSATSGRSDIEYEFTGQDLDTLSAYSDKLIPKYKKIPGLINLNSSFRSGKPEISILPSREKLSEAGLSAYDLAVALRSGVDGLVLTHYKDKGEEYDIRVELTDESVDSPEKIGNIPIVGKSGTYKLSQLSSITISEGYDKITHHNRAKSIHYGVDAAPGFATGDIQKQIIAISDSMNLPEGYQIKMSGLAKELDKTAINMLVAFLIASILTYMLLAAMLESLTQPLLILGTVPLALIGVIGSLVITGLSLNIIAMLSVVMLIGIVVNNAILQLDYTNILVRERNMSMTDALLEACPTKLKPIIMSNIAIILGMLPMALGIGASGKEFRQPMGVVSIGGIIVSTLLSLIVIPVLCHMFSKRKRPEKS